MQQPEIVNLRKYVKLKKLSHTLNEVYKQAVRECARMRVCLESISCNDKGHSGFMASAALKDIDSQRHEERERKLKEPPFLMHPVQRTVSRKQPKKHPPGTISMWDVSIEIKDNKHEQHIQLRNTDAFGSK